MLIIMPVQKADRNRDDADDIETGLGKENKNLCFNKTCALTEDM